MSYNLKAEDKEVQEFKDRLPFGVSKVLITGSVAAATDAGKDYIEVGLTDDDGIEDQVRLWFTGGAAKISFNTIRQIIVHNGKDDAEKDKMRAAVDKAKNTDELSELIDKIAGGQCWYTKYYDPIRTYTAADGSVRKSVNTNIYGYEPKLKPELMPRAKTDTEKAEEDFFKDAEAVDPHSRTAKGIPSKW